MCAATVDKPGPVRGGPRRHSGGTEPFAPVIILRLLVAVTQQRPTDRDTMDGPRNGDRGKEGY